MTYRDVVRWMLPRLSLALGGFAVGLIFAEAAMRVLGWSQDLDYRLYLRELKNSRNLPMEIWADPEGGELSGMFARARKQYPPLRPGAVELVTTSDYSVVYRINSHGLRDGEHAYERPAAGRRYLALGDSFTFGSGIAYGQRFSDIPERLLAGVEVVNMGVPGYGLDNAVLAYITEGRRYRPDAVLVFVSRHVLKRHETGVFDRGSVELPIGLEAIPSVPAAGDSETLYLARSDPFFRQSPWIVRSSYFLSYATYRWQVWRLSDRLRADDARFWRSHPKRPRPDEVVADEHPGRRARTIALLELLRDRSAEDGARLIVVNIDDGSRYDYIAEISGVTYRDLSGTLQRRGEERNLRFRFDNHYDADTHEFIGRQLTEILGEEFDLQR